MLAPAKYLFSRKSFIINDWEGPNYVSGQSTQLILTCSKATIKAIEKVVKYVQS